MSAIKIYYVSRWFYLHHFKLMPRLFLALMYVFCNCFIPYTADIGKNCKVAYKGMAIVIHKNASIGDYCIIGTCVTIGGNKTFKEVPKIGNNVYIASGAKVLGPIVVGNGSFIGANSVLTRSVPDNSLVSGIPARVIKENINIDEYR